MGWRVRTLAVRRWCVMELYIPVGWRNKAVGMIVGSLERTVRVLTQENERQECLPYGWPGAECP